MKRRKRVNLLLAVLAGFLVLTAASAANQAQRHSPNVTVYLDPT